MRQGDCGPDRGRAQPARRGRRGLCPGARRPRTRGERHPAACGDVRSCAADELRRALAGTVTIDRENAVERGEPARLLATPVTSGGQRFVVVVGAPLDEKQESLRSLARRARDRRPGGAAARVARRLRTRDGGAAPGGGHAIQGRRDHRQRAGRTAARAGGARRDRPPRRNPQPDARASRGRPRARACLRERREPRAAHAAGDPEDGARAGAAPCSHAGGAARLAALRVRGDGASRSARRGSARDRARRRWAVAAAR